MAGGSTKSQLREGGTRTWPGGPRSPQPALVSCPQPVPGPWARQGAAVTVGQEAGRDGALERGEQHCSSSNLELLGPSVAATSPGSGLTPAPSPALPPAEADPSEESVFQALKTQ